MIQVEHLTRYYGRRCAVQDVSFTVDENQVVGILGLNGAGKSTTLKVLAGLLPPSAGSVSIDGVNVVDAPKEQRAHIGYLPETPPLYGEMSVSDFLRFVGGLRGLSNSELDRAIPKAIATAQLTGWEDRVIDELSHGYRKRVGIAQAIVHSPKLVILDEPIGGLDPVQIVQMRDVIRDLSASCTVLVSSHILGEISQTCDRILVLNQGRLVAQGTEAELASRMSTGLSLELTLNGEPAAIKAVLDAHSGVESHGLVAVGDYQRATVTMKGDAREALVAALVGAGVGVRGLEDRSDELEEIFLGLTKEGKA